MNKKSQKTRKQEQVIFRCTKAEKEQLDCNARAQGLSVGRYLIKCSLEQPFTNNELEMIPDLVETWNQINELCHLVEASGDKLLLDKVKSCLNKGGHQANVNK